MRQLKVLVIGLLLISVWGVGLRATMQLIRAPGDPPRLPASSHARPLVVAPKQDRYVDHSRVVLAAAINVDGISSAVDVPIIRVDDKQTANKVFQWNAPYLDFGKTIWLRGGIESVELTLAIEPSRALINLPVIFEHRSQSRQIGVIDQVPANQPTTTVTLKDAMHTGPLALRASVAKRADNDYVLKIQADSTNPEVVLRQRDTTRGPVQPDLIQIRQGSHYPQRVELSAVTLAKGQPHAMAFGLRKYPEISDVFGIRLRKPTSGDAWVVEAATRCVAGDAPDLVRHNQLINAFSGEIHFLGESRAQGNHVYCSQVVTINQGTNAPPLLRDVVISRTDRTTPLTSLSRNSKSPSALKVFYSADTAVDQQSYSCVLFSEGRPVSEPQFLDSNGTISFGQLALPDGDAVVRPRFFAGETEITPPAVPNLEVATKTGGLRVEGVTPSTLGQELGKSRLGILFSRPVSVTGPVHQAVSLLRSADGSFDLNNRETVSLTAANVLLQPSNRELVIDLGNSILPGRYRLTVFGDKFSDEYGNYLESQDGVPKGAYTAVLGGATNLTADPAIPGVTRGNAPHVEFPEFVRPRETPTGFNPNDKVETRVARLYFYRDAHRVAQILNRRVQSYNRSEVAARRQLADKSRQEADSRTTQRQIAERKAIEDARRTRELENQLSDTQRSLNSTLQQLQSAARQNPPDADIVNRLQSAAQSFADQVTALESQVRSARDKEVASNENWQQQQREEELARKDQFRMETAAAHADPDTFAAGDPNSVDPVAQVSISVIGEGLLHLRGPLKGVNQVRMMVDQIDSPQGQVRVNVHSTQINGDEADELEVVANRIQTYIDQARFLTVQSAEMLRKAVVHVAGSRADEGRGMYSGATQAERDQLYLYNFFGRDFVDELRSMDSELLQTGNKLLSLHSMDVTSLSSALMLMALANNSTRLAILQEFERLVQSDLAMAERQYLHNGIGACTSGCKPGCKHHKHGPQLCLLSGNSCFTSLRGFFDAQISTDETMGPLQRETIGLAQILKARLITEMEYKQRVMERAIIEERMEAPEDEQSRLNRERDTQSKVRQARQSQVEARKVVMSQIAAATAFVDEAQDLMQTANVAMRGLALFVSNDEVDSAETVSIQESLLTVLQKTKRGNRNEGQRIAESTVLRGGLRGGETGFDRDLYQVNGVASDETTWLILERDDYRNAVALLTQIDGALQQLAMSISKFHPQTSETLVKIRQLRSNIDTVVKQVGPKDPNNIPAGSVCFATVKQIEEAILLCIQLLQKSRDFAVKAAAVVDARADFSSQFAGFERNAASLSGIERATAVFQSWTKFTATVGAIFEADNNSKLQDDSRRWLSDANTALERWLVAVSELDAAQSLAQDARRPLDHKKFLDMLIDDLEEKYIELLEGTRAHTANIDNYLKRLTTALDDDFNTQYYYPVFRLVREASQYKRVEFGQTETTNVLVNNREFGKVSPSATMEFDLPKRDILIQEGLDSALAIYNDVGALASDPNLLALAKLSSGGSTATGNAGGRAAVRSVLPGLNSSSSEQLLAQNSGSGPQFESNIEKLIPDPAIYKFETGTGYEIRPVIAPDGQAVVFDFHYLYTTQIREPVRADEKHLGRVKQHFIDTDVNLSNFELREVSRYVVALKAERTANGVPLLEDIPLVGALWRPLPNREKSLQQNIIMAQATIFPTLFDLMGLRWAPAISDLDSLRLSNREYLVRNRHRYLENRIYDYSSSRVDEFLRIPEDSRRADLYRSQETIPSVHPNGYRGPGLDLQNSQMREGYSPEEGYVNPGYIPSQSAEGATYLPHRQSSPYEHMPRGNSGFIDHPKVPELAPSQQPPTRSLNRIPTPPAVDGSSSSRKPDGWQYQRAQ